MLIAYGICLADCKSNMHRRSAKDILEILLLSMQMINPNKKYPEVVVATGVTGTFPKAVLERSQVAHQSGNPGHQSGAAWNIQKSLEFAKANGFDEMMCLGGDIIPCSKSMVEDEQKILHDSNAGYVAGLWQDNIGVNTQVFTCRPSNFFGASGICLLKSEELNDRSTLERHIGMIIRTNNIQFLNHSVVYRHTHDINEFRDISKQFWGIV